tara:strand:- start:336 stop:1094 length:759 start_codon:yes stop_codon:yes gene_type:complete
MKKITAIIPTFNEAHNIVDAIKSIEFANEIMIVDSFSTDKTIELAKPLSNTILKREFEYPASQKNWAINQAKYQWILLLDADERVTSKLKDEIIKIINSNTIYSGFWIKRKNYFMGKKINFSGWQRDKVIRLFKRDECKYEDKYVHEEIISNGKIGILKNKLTHNTFVSKEVYLKKLDRYAQWQAKDYDKRTKKINIYHTIIKPLFRFLKHYIIQLGILDGYIGFIISLYQAKAVKMRYYYLQKYRNARRNK